MTARFLLLIACSPRPGKTLQKAIYGAIEPRGRLSVLFVREEGFTGWLQVRLGLPCRSGLRMKGM